MSRHLRIITLLLATLFGAAWWAQAQNEKPAEATKKPAAPAVPATPKTPAAPKTPAIPAVPAVPKAAEKTSPADKKAAEKKDVKRDAEKPRSDREQDDAAEIAAISASAEAFAAAYNAHDATAIAKLFSPKAEIVDEDGVLTKGREAIEKNFASQFEEHPQATISIDIDSIRVLTPNIAVEEGVVRGDPGDDEPASVARYLVVHVKVEKEWQVASVRDFAASEGDLTPREHLEELDWLIGEWIDESPEATVHTRCDWDENGNFLIQNFSVHISGEVQMEGTQRIGWNPPTRSFKSWTFDSQGGHSEGLWSKDGDEWVVKTQGVSGDGDIASSTNVYRPIDGDTIGWRSQQRVVNGEAVEPIDEFIIKRRAPEPSEE